MEIPPTKLNCLVGSSRGTAAERAISEILELAAGKNKHGKIPLVFEDNLFPRPDDALRCFIAVREILAARGGVSAWNDTARRGGVVSNGLKWTRGKETFRYDKGLLMFRYVCSSCSSFRGWYAARQSERRWPDSSTTGWFGADGRGGSDLPRQSLFISL